MSVTILSEVEAIATALALEHKVGAQVGVSPTSDAIIVRFTVPTGELFDTGRIVAVIELRALDLLPSETRAASIRTALERNLRKYTEGELKKPHEHTVRWIAS